MKVQVMVGNKVGVFDPEGKVIGTSLESLGFEIVQSAHVGKVITLELATDDPAVAVAQVTEMCDAFLVNPVLERYDIKVL